MLTILNLIWVSIIILEISTFLLAFYKPISDIFPTWQDKFTVIQTIFTFFGFVIALIGVWEYISRVRKKAHPVLLINGKKEIIYNIKSFPSQIPISFYVLNDGNLILDKNCNYYNILIPKIIDIEIISGIKTESGTELVPKKANYQNDEGVISVGGSIPVLVNPKRIIKLFTAQLEVNAPINCIFKSYFSTPVGFIPNNIVVDSMNEPVENFDETKISFIKV